MALDAVGVGLLSDTADQAQAVRFPTTPVITADIDAIVAEARGERRQ